MKIQIYSPLNPCKGYNIFLEDGTHIKNSHASIYKFNFGEGEIQFLLGKQYHKFKKGKCFFEVPEYMIDIIQQEFVDINKNPKSLRFILKWNNT